MKILIAILLIIFLSMTLIHFLRMCKIVKYYQKENEELSKMLNESGEKQIPKKPIDFENEAYLCPNCRRNNFYNGTETLNKTNFCNYCGQRLDWSEK